MKFQRAKRKEWNYRGSQGLLCEKLLSLKGVREPALKIKINGEEHSSQRKCKHKGPGADLLGNSKEASVARPQHSQGEI